MKKLIKDVGVDAGMIIISDINYYKKYEKRSYIDSDISKIIKIKPGTYKVNWSIDNTWNGDIEGDKLIQVNSGKIVVSDPCYCISHENWDKWLEDTDFGNDVKDALIISKTSGDGHIILIHKLRGDI